MKNKLNNFSSKDLDSFKEILESKDFKKMYAKMHIPWIRRHNKINPNDVCPFCKSGKKFKKCKCKESYDNTPIFTINYK